MFLFAGFILYDTSRILHDRSENDAVGAPTGGMDQLVSLRGEAGHALFCDMRSHATRSVPLDLAGHGLTVLVADTRAPHRHSYGEYGARRRGCEEAARRLGVAALRDVSADDLDAALGRLEDDELRRAIEESKRTAAEEKAKQGTLTAEERDLLQAIKLSEEEERKRHEAVEKANERALFDENNQL